MFWRQYVIYFALRHSGARTSGFAIGQYVTVPSGKKKSRVTLKPWSIIILLIQRT